MYSVDHPRRGGWFEFICFLSKFDTLRELTMVQNNIPIYSHYTKCFFLICIYTLYFGTKYQQSALHKFGSFVLEPLVVLRRLAFVVTCSVS